MDKRCQNILFLLKIGDYKHIKSLQEGKIYMKNLKYYIDYEKENNDDCCGDKYEATLNLKNINITLFNPDTNKYICELKGNSCINFGFQKSPVFCMYSYDFRNCINFREIDKQKGEFDFKIDDECKKKLVNFGKDTLVIHNVPEFLKRIKNRLKEKNISFLMDLVKYYSEEYNDINQIINVFNSYENIAFQKREKYAYQQEFRIWINKDVEDNYILDIGDISDISKIFNTNDFMNLGIKITASYEKGEK